MQGQGGAGMEVALQQDNKAMTEFVYLKMGEMREGESVMSNWDKGKEAKNTVVWDRVGMLFWTKMGDCEKGGWR